MRESRRYPGFIIGTPAYFREATRVFRLRQRELIGAEPQRRRWRDAMRAMRAKDRANYDRSLS